MSEIMWIIEFECLDCYVVEVELYGVYYKMIYEFVERNGEMSVLLCFEVIFISLFVKLMFLFFFMMSGMIKKCLMEDLGDIKIKFE